MEEGVGGRRGEVGVGIGRRRGRSGGWEWEVGVRRKGVGEGSR